MNMHIHRQQQTGLVTVEFALIGAFFFLVLFAIIEFGRVLFVWNTLDEVTRRAARLAAVCPMNQTAAVIDRSIFQGNVLSNLDSSNINVEYLTESFGDPLNVLEDVRYVRASVQNYQHQLLIPFIPTSILTAPDFSTTLPSESLGTSPAGSWTVTCL
ncbi:TadE/TadG family type IV pilus assembly protein [Amphritea balenae]|uniref:Pilus assembly protein n=1 Tax=Amphritea balenae TaxID=452629 RepID=A0A3P1SVJ8_9GAMM|nr:TadE family protein [Amphritea balenae]RRD01181.1 pilus assembly protein [Amphritea balenae]GGK59250.1 hypothetical protein GCM10007941_06860 [Amphritea balenae]